MSHHNNDSRSKDQGLYVGVVKCVLSADTVILQHPKRRPPVEKALRLSNLRTPRLGRVSRRSRRPDNDDDEGGKDERKIEPEEDYAFEAREYVRKLLVGRKVWFEILYRHEPSQRDYGHVFLYSDEEMKRRQQQKNKPTHNYEESLSYHLLKRGYGRVMNRNKSPQALIDASTQAEKNKVGVFSDERYQKRNITFNCPPKELHQKYRNKKDDRDLNKGWIPVIVEYVINGHLLKVMFPDFEYAVVQLTGVRCPTNKNKKLFLESRHFTERKCLHKENVFLKVDAYDPKYDNLLVTIRVGSQKADKKMKKFVNFRKPVKAVESKKKKKKGKKKKVEEVEDEEDEGEEEKEEVVDYDKLIQEEEFKSVLQIEVLKKGFGEFLEFFEVIKTNDFPLYEAFRSAEIYARKHKIRKYSEYFFPSHFDTKLVRFKNKREIRNLKILEILSGDCLRILYSTKKQKYNEEIFFLSSIRCHKNLYFYETIELLRKELMKYNQVGLYLKVDYVRNKKKYISLYSNKTNENVLLNYLKKGFFFLLFHKYDQKRSDEFLEYFEIFKTNKNVKKIGYHKYNPSNKNKQKGHHNQRGGRQEEAVGKSVLNFENVEPKKREKLLRDNFAFLKSSITMNPSENAHKGKKGSGGGRVGIVLKVYYGNFFKIYLYKKNMIIKFHLKSLFCYKCKASFYPLYEGISVEDEDSSSSDDDDDDSDDEDNNNNNKKKKKKKKKDGSSMSLDLKKPFGFEARRFSEDHILFKRVNLHIYDLDVKQTSYSGQIYLNKKNYMEPCLKSGYFFLNRSPNVLHKYVPNYNYFMNMEKKVEKQKLNLWKLNYNYNQLLNLFFNGSIHERGSPPGGRRRGGGGGGRIVDEGEGEIEGEEEEEEGEQQQRGSRRRRMMTNVRVVKTEEKLCRITHIVHMNHFFIQTSDSKKQLIRIEKELKSFDLHNKEPYNPAVEDPQTNKPGKSSEEVKGTKIFCKYYGDEHWYRGIILNQVNENNFSVFYPDYGNSEVVNVKNIRKYIHKSPQIPYQSKEVFLAFVVMNRSKNDFNKKNAIQRISKLSRNKEFWATLQYKENHKMFVSLKDKNSKQDISKILLNENWVTIDPKFDQENNNMPAFQKDIQFLKKE